MAAPVSAMASASLLLFSKLDFWRIPDCFRLPVTLQWYFSNKHVCRYSMYSCQ